MATIVHHLGLRVSATKDLLELKMVTTVTIAIDLLRLPLRK